MPLQFRIDCPLDFAEAAVGWAGPIPVPPGAFERRINAGIDPKVLPHRIEQVKEGPCTQVGGQGASSPRTACYLEIPRPFQLPDDLIGKRGGNQLLLADLRQMPAFPVRESAENPQGVVGLACDKQVQPSFVNRLSLIHI